jgi:hypothetical protein
MPTVDQAHHGELCPMRSALGPPGRYATGSSGPAQVACAHVVDQPLREMHGTTSAPTRLWPSVLAAPQACDMSTRSLRPLAWPRLTCTSACPPRRHSTSAVSCVENATPTSGCTGRHTDCTQGASAHDVPGTPVTSTKPASTECRSGRRACDASGL